MLTSLEQPKPTASHHTPPTLPSTPSTLHSHPLQPIHRACRGPLCCGPHTHHTSLLLPLTHPTFSTMAQTTSAPPHPTSHVPLPQFSFLKCSLCQNYISTPQPHNAATINTATFTSAPPALASRTGNTTVGQNSNSYKTTFQFQLN